MYSGFFVGVLVLHSLMYIPDGAIVSVAFYGHNHLCCFCC